MTACWSATDFRNLRKCASGPLVSTAPRLSFGPNSSEKTQCAETTELVGPLDPAQRSSVKESTLEWPGNRTSHAHGRRHNSPPHRGDRHGAFRHSVIGLGSG